MLSDLSYIGAMKPLRIALAGLGLVSLTAAGAIGLSAAHNMSFDLSPAVASAKASNQMQREMVVPVQFQEPDDIPGEQRAERPRSNPGYQVKSITPDLLEGQEVLPERPAAPRVIPASAPVPSPAPAPAAPPAQRDAAPSFLIGVYR